MKFIPNDSSRYNSAVFSTIVANEYMVFTGPESFVENGVANIRSIYNSLSSEYYDYSDFEYSTRMPVDAIHSIYDRLVAMKRLENEGCMRKYA